ncbi:MAG: DUF3822 family protein [Salibacteraceae bacterium]
MTKTDTEEYFDLSYSREPASYYYLVLCLSKNEAQAVWYHSTKNLITGFASYPFTGSIKALFDDYKFLSSDFKEVLVSYNASNYLLSPRSMAFGDQTEAFQLTNELNDEFDTLKRFQLVNTKTDISYTIPQSIDNEVHQLIHHHQIFPLVAAHIEHELNVVKKAQQKQFLFAHISEEQIDIRVYLEGKLHMANSFFQSGKEDIAYFILFAAEVLGVDVENSRLIASGNIEIGDKTWNLLTKYWKQIEYKDPLNGVEISPSLTDYPKATFDHLTQALLCAS